ncbi:hypothetical protein AB0F17_34945 [Nonomuraea sp. NPDC026600]|uniref:hypothetical protein n=1 Tax=Nonomuraea sp. NPDC026600 TaxID=3155363 RepID=UPI003410CD8D
MGRYLEGPDGLRVEPVELRAGTAHWIFAQMREPSARPGEVWYKVTRDGHAVDVPGYYQLEEIVSLAELREVDEGAGTETA